MNLKEFSQIIGLSQTTVSRALNGYPEVNEKTRRRVAEAAKRYNYRPSARARSLATGRAMAIAHVVPISANHELANPIFSEFIVGAGEVYASAGYDTTLCFVAEHDEIRLFRDLAARRAVDGFIVHGPRVEDPRIPLLREIGLPFVVHGRALHDVEGYVWLDVRNRAAFRRGTEFLLDLGHRRVGLINGDEAFAFAARRRRGYDDALRDRGIAASPDLLYSSDMTEPDGYRAASRMLDLGAAAPTAFIASSTIMSIGVRRAVHERGLALGRDISLVTFDDDLSYLRDVRAEPIFTSLRSPVRPAGARCAELLLAYIETPEREPAQERWDVQLIVGASTGPAPKG